MLGKLSTANTNGGNLLISLGYRAMGEGWGEGSCQLFILGPILWTAHNKIDRNWGSAFQSVSSELGKRGFGFNTTNLRISNKDSSCLRIGNASIYKEEHSYRLLCVSMPKCFFLKSLEVPHKYVSCSRLLNLPQLQKQLILRDSFCQLLLCVCESLCTRVSKS